MILPLPGIAYVKSDSEPVWIQWGVFKKRATRKPHPQPPKLQTMYSKLCSMSYAMLFVSTALLHAFFFRLPLSLSFVSSGSLLLFFCFYQRWGCQHFRSQRIHCHPHASSSNLLPNQLTALLTGFVLFMHLFLFSVTSPGCVELGFLSAVVNCLANLCYLGICLSVQITGHYRYFAGVRLTAQLSLLCKYAVCFSGGTVWAVIGLFLNRADPFLLFVQILNKPVPSTDGATWQGLWRHGWVNRDQLAGVCQNFLEGGAFTSLMGCSRSQGAGELGRAVIQNGKITGWASMRCHILGWLHMQECEHVGLCFLLCTMFCFIVQ